MSDLSSLLIELVCCVAVIILINLRCTMEQRVQLPSPNKKRLSLSLLRKKKQGANSEDSVAKRPRFECASTSEFETASKKFVPKNTCASLKRAFSLFTEWIAHNEREENGRRYKSEDLWLCQDPERLVMMLSLFFMEVRQRNGKPYTPKSLLQILTNLYKHASTIDSGCLPFMSAKDSRFQRLHTVLDNTSCQLHKEGIGVTKVQARVVTTTEENCLWDTGVIATDSPTSLLNGVFFYCGLYLCLRGGGEHRSIKYSQFAIKTVVNPNDPSEMIKCLVYTEHGSKNRTGSCHQVHLDNKEVVHYANASLGDRCFVSMVEMYLSKLPQKAIEKDLFYCKPAKNFEKGVWYYDSPIGHNLLARKLKTMFESAGLDGENISNHSLRATGVSRMFAQGVPEKMIMERSGHLSSAGVRSYERTTSAQKQTLSDTLSILACSSTAELSELKPTSGILTERQPNVMEGETEIKTEETSNGKENDASNILKRINIKKLDGCTINFNFSF